MYFVVRKLASKFSLPYVPSMLTPDSLKAARALLRWTQQDLANVARVSITTIKTYEAGQIDPRMSTVDKIMAALKLGGAGLVFEPDGTIAVKLSPGAVVPNNVVSEQMGGANQPPAAARPPMWRRLIGRN